MSLLSLLTTMIDRGVLTEEIFHRLYGKRVDYIYYNAVIRKEELEKEGHRWRDFQKLCLKRNLNKFQYITWPPYWVLIMTTERISATNGWAQALVLAVLDSIESLNSGKDVLVLGAEVTATIVYPSGSTKYLEGKTNEEGEYNSSWVIEEKDRITGEGKVTVKVSKENKTSSDLTDTFQVDI